MRLPIVFVATFVVVSSAGIQSKVDETSQLKELLNAVKHYLNKEATNDMKEARTGDVCTAEKVFYSSTSVQAQVDAEQDGKWTAFWINADRIQLYGFGEYEDCSRVIYEQDLKKNCWLYCANPLAAKIVFEKPCDATWAEIYDCVGNAFKESSCGFRCANLDVSNAIRGPKCQVSKCQDYGLGVNCTLCPQIKVKFFCPGTAAAPPVNACCPDPKLQGPNCASKSSNLRDSLEKLSMEQRRDVAAGILQQIRGAVEVDEN